MTAVNYDYCYNYYGTAAAVVVADAADCLNLAYYCFWAQEYTQELNWSAWWRRLGWEALNGVDHKDDADWV